MNILQKYVYFIVTFIIASVNLDALYPFCVAYVKVNVVLIIVN